MDTSTLMAAIAVMKNMPDNAAASAAAAAESAEAAQEVLNNIPQDYTELSEDVGNLKSIVNEVYDHKVLDYTLVTPQGDSNGVTQVYFPVKAGRYYLISIALTNTLRTASITTRLTQAGSTVESVWASLSVQNHLFVPQYDANYFVISTKSEGTFSVVEFTSLTELASTVNAMQKKDITATLNSDETVAIDIIKGYSYYITFTLSVSTATATISTMQGDTIVEQAYAGIPVVNYIFTATENAEKIKVTTTASAVAGIEIATIMPRDAVEKSEEVEDMILIDKEYDSSLASGRIKTGVAIGDVVNTTPTSSSSLLYAIIPCSSGDEFKLTGTGSTSWRLWAFVDQENKLLSASGNNATASNLSLYATKNGSLIINVDKTSAHSIVKINGENAIDYLLDKVADDSTTINKLNKIVNTIPTEEFDLNDHDTYDVSAYRALVGYGSEPHDPYLEQFHDLFDTLVTQYPSYVSKQDAAELAELRYPTYANGISVAGDYEVTPAYKTYIYKFIDTNAGAGNGTYNAKKKLLITCCTHGNEIMTPLNAFIFASELCKGTKPNYAKFRAAYDVYIIPCLNGYGMYHTMRANANWVDINRNFPTDPWEESGAETIGDANLCVYTGATAGSEFETQLVMSIYNKLHFDFHIDHHNYSGGDGQFYTNVVEDEFLRLTHQSMVDCSIAFVKNYPTYYGSNYMLIIPNRDITYAPRMTEHNRNGKMCIWFAQQGCPFSCTIEIASDIRYLAGVNTETYNDWAGNDTFSVAEYTLRNQAMRYGQWVLKNT